MTTFWFWNPVTVLVMVKMGTSISSALNFPKFSSELRNPHLLFSSSFSPPSAGTNSTNAVSGSGLCQSQGSSQCLAPNMSAPHQRKGTFTDDLHKLVDNWARDAMNLSQVGCSLVLDLRVGHVRDLIKVNKILTFRGREIPNSCSRPQHRVTAMRWAEKGETFCTKTLSVYHNSVFFVHVNCWRMYL